MKINKMIKRTLSVLMISICMSLLCPSFVSAMWGAKLIECTERADLERFQTDIRALLDRLIDDDMSDVEKYFRIAYWIDNNIEYECIKTARYRYNPIYTFFDRKGACAEQADLYALMCNEAGLACYTLGMKNHCINMLPNINGYICYTDLSLDKGEIFATAKTEQFPFLREENLGFYEQHPYAKRAAAFRFTKEDTVEEEWEKFLTYYWGPNCSDYIERGSGVPGMSIAIYAGDLDMDWYYGYDPNTISLKSCTIKSIGRFNFQKYIGRPYKYGNFTEGGDNGRSFKREDYPLIDEFAKTIELETPDGVELELGKDYILKSLGCNGGKLVINLEGTSGMEGYEGSKARGVISPGPMEPVDFSAYVAPKDTIDIKETMVVGGTTAEPSIARSASDSEYECRTSNSSIAVANESGVISGKGAGKATITVTKAKVIYNVEVTVSDPAFGRDTYTMNKGETKDSGYDAKGFTATFESSDSSIASIKNGKITANKIGTAQISAIAGGVKKTATVKVFDPKITGPDSAIAGGNKAVYKIDCGYGPTTWSTSNTSIATINVNGELNILSGGTVDIKAVNNGKSLTKKITVHGEVGFTQKAYTANKGDVLKGIFNNEGIAGTAYKSDNTAVAQFSTNGDVTCKAAGNTNLEASLGGNTYKVSITVYDPTITGDDVVMLDNKTIKLNLVNGNGQTAWSSANPSIATVDKNGNVKGISEGTAKISAANNGKTVYKDIRVCRVPKFTGKGYSMNTGEVLTGIFDNAGNKTEYSSSNTAVATVDANGKVTGIAKGKAQINAVIGSKKYTTTVNVFDPSIQGGSVIYLNNKKVGYKIVNGNGNTSWSSSDTSIATVDKKGNVKGVSEGTVKIYAANNGKTVYREIKVCRVPKFTKKSYVMNKDDTLAGIFDDAGLYTAYTSNKPSVATIDENGRITAYAKGKAKITAASDGKKYTVSLDVYDPLIKGGSIVYLNNKKAGYKIVNGNGKTSWASSDTSIATVDKKGNVKGVSEGYVTISATNNGRTVYKDVRICRIPKYTKKSYTMNAGDSLSDIFDDADIGATYVSNKPGIVMIDGAGNVTAVAKGTAKITATVAGTKYTTTIKVFDPKIKGASSITVGGKATAFKIVDGNGKTSWSSSNTEIATVNKDGKVTGKSSGIVVITAVNNGREMHKEVTVGYPTTAKK